jgi:hypothetical protein
MTDYDERTAPGVGGQTPACTKSWKPALETGSNGLTECRTSHL